MDICLPLCSRVKELKRAREHETPQKSPLAMWSLSWLLFYFPFVPETFYKEMGKKKQQFKHCNYYDSCSVTGSTIITCTTAFFHISILSTDLILVGEWRLLRDYKLKGWGGGVQNIGFLAFFALFHGLRCLFWMRRSFERRRKRTQDVSLRRPITREDLKRRELRLLQKISEDRETTQKHSGL